MGSQARQPRLPEVSPVGSQQQRRGRPDSSTRRERPARGDCNKLSPHKRKTGTLSAPSLRALPGLVLSCVSRRRKGRWLYLWGRGRRLPRRGEANTQRGGNGGNGSPQTLSVFLFFGEGCGDPLLLLPGVGCLSGSRVLARAEEPLPRERAPGPRDRQRANQRPGQQPQRPATGSRSPPGKITCAGHAWRRWRAGLQIMMGIAGHVSRAMLSRCSHVRMEAKQRAPDEIAARQIAADRKRKDAERQQAVVSRVAVVQ